jgi:2-phospho-L-lactate transferase
MIVVLTGGTGGAKLIEGLAAEIDPAELTIIANTGDDCVFHGLNISPDIDTIIYTLAGLVDSAKGWGIKADTFSVLNQLRCLGDDAWFQLGDKDLATHITRTRLLREGSKLSADRSASKRRSCRCLMIASKRGSTHRRAKFPSRSFLSKKGRARKWSGFVSLGLTSASRRPA